MYTSADVIVDNSRLHVEIDFYLSEALIIWVNDDYCTDGPVYDAAKSFASVAEYDTVLHSWRYAGMTFETFLGKILDIKRD